LEGFHVLDCTRLLPYQYCTLILGDLGAEVLKIEELQKGDYGRWADSSQSYESTAFSMANRNKKSMKLNLKDERGKEIFKKLIFTYDVLVESFRPGVMKRLGLGYKTLCRLKSDIIYCSATGYGQNGPYSTRPGHDINYLSISGILGCTGEHTGRPVIPGIPIGDMAGGGIFTALVIIVALLGRERTGQGQFIDVAQTDVLTSLNLLNIAEALARRKGQKARPYDLRGASICYNTYMTADNKYIALGALEQKFWINFCNTVGKKEWITKHLAPYEEGDETTEALKALFVSKTQKEWIDLFENVDTCLTPVLKPQETLKEGHLWEREAFTKMNDLQRRETLQIGFPAKFSEKLNFKRSPAPFWGQHTNEILVSLGYTHSAIQSLAEDGVI
jgi:crotonobetainyl-CoA:carnitine CoA-transferase CaiB-like acyl-CoA transferase